MSWFEFCLTQYWWHIALEFLKLVPTGKIRCPTLANIPVQVEQCLFLFYIIDSFTNFHEPDAAVTQYFVWAWQVSDTCLTCSMRSLLISNSMSCWIHFSFAHRKPLKMKVVIRSNKYLEVVNYCPKINAKSLSQLPNTDGWLIEQ